MLKTIIVILFCCFMTNVTATSLITHFDHPQDQYKPWAFWYWINGNITQQGIEADLKSMSDAGLGGVVLMHINEHGMIPEGPVRFLSPEYKQLLQYAFSSAAKHNLQINLYNSEGWSVAGGPWISPEMGMKELAWSELNIKDKSQRIQFPKPHAPLGYYQDIATLAFPTPSGFIEPDFKTLVGQLEISGNEFPTKQSATNPNSVIDGDWNSQISPQQDPETGETYIKLAFKEDYTFSNAFIKFAAYGMMGRNVLMVSDDGKHYREVASDRRGQIYDDIGCFQFEPVTTRHAKFVFKPTDSKLLYTAMPKVTVAVREIALDNRSRVNLWCKKAAHAFPFFNSEIERITSTSKVDKNNSIDLESIVDVSKYLDRQGHLNWTPPTDDWTIVRFGMSSTEAINRPGSIGGEGLEVDKMNVNALDVHFRGYLREAKLLAGEELGNAFFATHADSWEVGRQNWTQDFEQAFTIKRGYSPIQFLPATLGYVINNQNHTERFLWDMRKTIADLIAERFYGGMRERANSMGLKFSAQSMKPFIDNLYALGQADIVYANSNFVDIEPTKNRQSQHNAYMTAKMAASAGSIYDRLVSSESFTALPEANRWLNHPQYYKPQADTEFAAGVTQITHHLFTHQPWTTIEPGMTLGYWGLHFERTQTWWHEISTWNKYLSRTQAMLRQGQPVIDILHLLGDDSSTKATAYDDKLVLPGYDFEFISSHGLLNKVYINNSNKLAFASGREYRLLSLADDMSMRPEVLQKIKNMLNQGMILVGKPPKQTPSLQGGQLADKKLSTLIAAIWGGNYQGQVFSTINQAFEHLSLSPDLNIVGSDNKILWRHHTLIDQQKDFYFISNVEETAANVSAEFRVINKVPELWDPLTGDRKRIQYYQERDGKTIISLTLQPLESYFVVFSPKPTTTNVLNTKPMMQVKTIVNSWEVDFIRGSQRPESIILNNLMDLKDHVNNDVKYFTGTARYQTSFNFSPKTDNTYFLDLGEVHQFARVAINGHDLGVQMWSPYQYDIKNYLLKGNNSLVIEVTNLWPNRLIGDERQYQDTAKWKANGYQGAQLIEFPKWLTGANPNQPGERTSFATWKHWSKDDALQPSGLIGPINILQQKKIKIN